jgi:hypothetical protein
MGGVFRTRRKDKKCIHNLVGKPEGRELHGSPERK